jgi:hypothetical protein
MNDSTMIKISWDTTTETHTVAALREKFASTNLFHEDGTWELTAPAAKSYILTMASLEDVLDLLEDGDEWTCDNCTVSMAPVLTHDEQEMSQGYHGPSFKDEGEPFQWNEDGTLNKYPDEPVLATTGGA